MKTKFIFLLLAWCIFTPSSFSQKVIEPNKKWMYAIGQDYPTPEITRHDCLTIGEDTVISNKEYYKLYNLYNCEFEKSNLRGFIRETEDAKVYFLSVNEEQEWLLYDFGLNVGDSIYSERDDRYAHLDSIIFDVNNRRIYCLTYNKSDHMQWIEEVGSNIGLLMEKITGGLQIFTCCFKDEELIYRIPKYNSCDITLSNEVKEMPVPFKLYPNPASKEIKVQFNKFTRVACAGEIISIYGTKLKSFNLNINDNCILDVRSLKPGMYIIQVQCGTEVYSDTFIIN